MEQTIIQGQEKKYSLEGSTGSSVPVQYTKSTLMSLNRLSYEDRKRNTHWNAVQETVNSPSVHQRYSLRTGQVNTADKRAPVKNELGLELMPRVNVQYNYTGPVSCQ